MTNDTARARLVATRYVRSDRPRIRVRVAPINHPPEADMTTTFLASPYFTPGRGGAKITDIVVHWMATTLAGADATFTNSTRRVSAHYGIENGTVHQYVRESDTAWHAGDWAENCRSIGIEHSAQPGRDASTATVATSVALIVSLCRRYGIDPSHVYPHSRFTATQCPGTLPVADIAARVRARLAAPITPPPARRKAPTMLLIQTTTTVYLTNGQTKRHVGPSEVAAWLHLLGQSGIETVAQGIVDAIPNVT